MAVVTIPAFSASEAFVFIPACSMNEKKEGSGFRNFPFVLFYAIMTA